MPASDFNIIPTWVQLNEPSFFVTQKQSESLKKDRQALSVNPICVAQLQFNGISDAQRKTIYDHYIARKGCYESFGWPAAYVPDYIQDKFNFIVDIGITVRWIPGSFNQLLLLTVGTCRSECLLKFQRLRFREDELLKKVITELLKKGTIE